MVVVVVDDVVFAIIVVAFIQQCIKVGLQEKGNVGHFVFFVTADVVVDRGGGRAYIPIRKMSSF